MSEPLPAGGRRRFASAGGDGDGDGDGGARGKAEGTGCQCSFASGDMASATFRPGVFAAVFLYHLLSPLSLPVLVAREGWLYARNQRWVGGRPTDLILQYSSSSAWWALIAVYASAGEEDRASVSLVEVLGALLMLAVHRAMVGAKYAFAPEGILRRVRTTDCVEEVQSLELITWGAYPASLVRGELDRAATRAGILLSNVHFFVDPDWAGGAGEEDDDSGDSGDDDNDDNDNDDDDNATADDDDAPPRLVKLCARATALELLQRSGEDATNWHDRLFPAAVLLSLCNAVLVPTTRVVRGESAFGTGSPTAVSIVVLSFLLNGVFFQILFRFLMVGVTDYNRRYEMMRYLDALISTARVHPKRRVASHYRGSSRRGLLERAARRGIDGAGGTPRDERFPDVQLPRVSLAVPDNTVAWVVTREVALAAGLQFRCRVHVYGSFALGGILVAAVLLLSDLVRGRLNVAILTVVSFQVLVVAACVLGMAHYASRAEAELHAHRHTLVRIQLELRERHASAVARQAHEMRRAAQGDEAARSHELRNARAVDLAADADSLVESALLVQSVESSFRGFSIAGLSTLALTRSLVGGISSAILVGSQLLQRARGGEGFV